MMNIMNLQIFYKDKSSVESQKGVNEVQWHSIENQKDTIGRHFVQL